MKLTNELKAKFFALYWGQKIGIIYKFQKDGLLYVNDYFLETSKNRYLLLKPLSLISDKDAIEVAKIEGYTYDYLRSRGYALPFMGISVEQQIEAGWIKLIE